MQKTNCFFVSKSTILLICPISSFLNVKIIPNPHAGVWHWPFLELRTIRLCTDEAEKKGEKELQLKVRRRKGRKEKARTSSSPDLLFESELRKTWRDPKHLWTSVPFICWGLCLHVLVSLANCFHRFFWGGYVITTAGKSTLFWTCQLIKLALLIQSGPRMQTTKSEWHINQGLWFNVTKTQLSVTPDLCAALKSKNTFHWIWADCG